MKKTFSGSGFLLIITIVLFIIMYGIGGNEQSALLIGLNVRAVRLRAYVLSSFLCSIGGFLYALNSCAGFVEQVKWLEMNAIAALLCFFIVL